MTGRLQRLNGEERVMRVFRVGGAVGMGLIITEGLIGGVLVAYLPLTLPLGASPLAELGVIFGACYFVAEVIHGRRKTP